MNIKSCFANNSLAKVFARQEERMTVIMSCASKTDRAIEGIKCTVSNCEYHSGETKCEASAIEVCTTDPIQQCSVECKTFRPKTGA